MDEHSSNYWNPPEPKYTLNRWHVLFIRREGHTAAWEGLDRETNPYDKLQEQEEWLEWDYGWGMPPKKERQK